ncbi:50S ribosomal protein L7/L12 [Pontiella sulfatireligans]|uniref:Large ribosomal subunit protein bL12 n=2 Tax=Pontiella sulfatireligans TaxID=2750658 RepID=A0A6C2UKD2_9BACT|nr:50S ribosomal protein L7/L12 [Pontiella sulfatireligans]
MSEEVKDEVVLEGKMAEFVDWVETISVLELSKLVKGLEDRLGVSAAAPAAAAVAAPAGDDEGGAAAAQTEFEVVLTAAGGSKIQVIKELRSITGLGLKEAKELVDGAPTSVKAGLSKEDADAMKEKLEGVGASVDVK